MHTCKVFQVFQMLQMYLVYLIPIETMKSHDPYVCVVYMNHQGLQKVCSHLLTNRLGGKKKTKNLNDFLVALEVTFRPSVIFILRKINNKTRNILK